MKNEVVQEETSEDFPALSSTVVVQEKTNWGAFRRVSFQGDSENLMKPPCETKIFDKNDSPSSISDEEEEIVLKTSAGAWKPRRLQESEVVSPERQSILNEIAEKEVELKSYGNDSWADACEIEELEEEIMALRKKLD